MKLKKNYKCIVLLNVCFVALNFMSCSNELEKVNVQGLYTYDDQYYENLRTWKKSPHEISYVYFASWASTKNPTSWGERIKGLPDSLDICNLWMGIPTEESNPIAYEDMRYCQEKLGTRFVMHADMAHYNHTFWDRTWNESLKKFEYVWQTDEDGNILKDSDGNPIHKIIKTDPSDEYSLLAYARWAVDTVLQCHLDGVDFDYEGWTSAPALTVIEEVDKYFGQDGLWPEKLLIIDYNSVTPGSNADKYTDYFVQQLYSMSKGNSPSGFTYGHPMNKTVFIDSCGAEAGEDGINGSSIVEYAAWEPPTGRKGGFGAYYIDYNYMSRSGIPYNELRIAIQSANPAIHK